MNRPRNLGRAGWFVSWAAMLTLAVPAAATIDLTLAASQGSFAVGDVIDVDLKAIWDPGTQPDEGAGIASMRVILRWDHTKLRLLGYSETGPYDWLSAGFPPDAYGLNGSLDDGNASFQALSQLGDPALASVDGLSVGTLHFEALSPATDVWIRVVPLFGLADTHVCAASTSGTYVHGQLGELYISISGDQWETGDMNCDGVVDYDDVNPFVVAMTFPDQYAFDYPDCDPLNGDFNGDGVLDMDDIHGFVVRLTGG